MSLQRTKGIIIRSIDYKDSSKVITLFSENSKNFLWLTGKKIANTINASYETETCRCCYV